MTYTKNELENIVEPLGSDPRQAIAELLRESSELAFLKNILPGILAKGAIATLYERPAQPEPSLTWHSMSNQELAALPSEGDEASGCERLRRSFLGLQAHNEAAPPQHRLYPTLTALSRLANTSESVARKWWGDPLIASEVSRYSDGLGLECGHSEDEREKYNQAVLGELKVKTYQQLIKWPKAYD